MRIYDVVENFNHFGKGEMHLRDQCGMDEEEVIDYVRIPSTGLKININISLCHLYCEMNNTLCVFKILFLGVGILQF